MRLEIFSSSFTTLIHNNRLRWPALKQRAWLQNSTSATWATSPLLRPWGTPCSRGGWVPFFLHCHTKRCYVMSFAIDWKCRHGGIVIIIIIIIIILIIIIVVVVVIIIKFWFKSTGTEVSMSWWTTRGSLSSRPPRSPLHFKLRSYPENYFSYFSTFSSKTTFSSILPFRSPWRPTTGPTKLRATSFFPSWGLIYFQWSKLERIFMVYSALLQIF